VEWIERKELDDYNEDYEWAEFVYLTKSGYSDTAFCMKDVPSDATHFMVLPPKPDTGE